MTWWHPHRSPVRLISCCPPRVSTLMTPFSSSSRPDTACLTPQFCGVLHILLEGGEGVAALCCLVGGW